MAYVSGWTKARKPCGGVRSEKWREHESIRQRTSAIYLYLYNTRCSSHVYLSTSNRIRHFIQIPHCWQTLLGLGRTYREHRPLLFQKWTCLFRIWSHNILFRSGCYYYRTERRALVFALHSPNSLIRRSTSGSITLPFIPATRWSTRSLLSAPDPTACFSILDPPLRQYFLMARDKYFHQRCRVNLQISNPRWR